MMRRINILSGVVLAIFGLAMIFLVIPWQVEPGPEGMMAPGLVPNLTMIVIILLSLLLVVVNLRSPDNETQTPSQSPFTRDEFLASAKIAAVFATSIGLFHWVSPIVGGVALMVLSLIALGERSLLVIVAMPAGFMFAIWLLFYKVLGTTIL